MGIESIGAVAPIAPSTSNRIYGQLDAAMIVGLADGIDRGAPFVRNPARTWAGLGLSIGWPDSGASFAVS
jgi:hypothetical protein